MTRSFDPVPFSSASRPDSTLQFRSGRSSEAGKLFGPIAETFDEVLGALRQPSQQIQARPPVAGLLAGHLEEFPLAAASRRSLEALEDPATRIILCGQQPAIAGGPLMVMWKAFCAARLARRLTDAGMPTVPLFWIADEDHDSSELFSGTHQGEELLANPFSKSRRMISELEFSDSAENRLETICNAIGVAPFSGALRSVLEPTMSAGPSEEFIRLLLALLPDSGLLPVRPGWLREAQGPILTRILAEATGWQQAVASGSADLNPLGLPVAVGNPAALPIFWIDEDGSRHRVFPHKGSFAIGSPDGRTISAERLRNAPVDEPNRISPDGLLRPLIQDSIFQTAATLLGPSEINYHLQIRHAYPLLGVRRPLLLGRPRVRPASQEDVEKLAALGLDGISPGADLATLAPSPEGERLAARLEEVLGGAADQLEDLAADGDASDALRRRSSRLARRWRQDAGKLAAAVLRGYHQGSPHDLQRLEELRRRVFPSGVEPERSVNTLSLWAQHGPALWELLSPAADHFDGRYRWIGTPQLIPGEVRSFDGQC